MGSGDWFKKVIRLKKAKGNRSNQSKGCTEFSNGACNGKSRFLGMSAEDIAATRIQTAFRAYKARKNLRYLKGKVRLKVLIESHSVGKQASSTLVHLHSWSRIQSEIRARRLAMVTEDRIRQKKLESQLKLEAKLHDLEVEWCGGTETMEETLARIHQREEAAIKRERTLAYAFSHQWRANSGSNIGPPELGKANWGWSWMERWIAARPWESRVVAQKSPVKPISRTPSKACKNTTTPTIKPAAASAKIISPNGKGPTKARRLSYPASEKPSPPSNAKVGPDRVETGQLIS